MAGTTGIVKSVCVSDRRGIQKTDVKTGEFRTTWGIAGDAHGGDWHRQVSLLSYDKIRDFNALGANVEAGAFGENLVVEGIDFKNLPVGTKLRCGDSLLEITQIGKECHTHCQIFHKMGDCIMPREGVFARVLQDGTIAQGDTMEILENTDKRFQAAVVTLSDKGSRGEREDTSGPLIARLLEEAGYRVVEKLLLADDRKKLEEELINFADRRRTDLIITTGGTGFSRRDITPEATIAVAERMAPGIAEAIRAHSLTITGHAMLGRGVAAIRGGALIVNLPGSEKAVRESLEYILPFLEHGLEVLRGEAEDCGERGHSA